MSIDIDHDHAGWLAPGHVEPITDFDFAEVDRHLSGIEEEPDDVQARAAVVLARIFAEVWNAATLKAALTKFTAITAGLRPDLVAATYDELGGKLGCTKQNLSKATLRAEKVLGIKFGRTRGMEGRAHMREARMKNPVGRNQKRANV